MDWYIGNDVYFAWNLACIRKQFLAIPIRYIVCKLNKSSRFALILMMITACDSQVPNDRCAFQIASLVGDICPQVIVVRSLATFWPRSHWLTKSWIEPLWGKCCDLIGWTKSDSRLQAKIFANFGPAKPEVISPTVRFSILEVRIFFYFFNSEPEFR